MVSNLAPEKATPALIFLYFFTFLGKHPRFVQIDKVSTGFEVCLQRERRKLLLKDLFGT